MGALAFTGPVPPAGRSWCTMCSASWKAKALAVLDDQVKAAQRDGGGGELDLSGAMRGEMPPELAVATGLCQLPVPGSGQAAVVPVPLCWSHLQAVHFTDSVIAPATPGQLPGGAVRLDRRRQG